MTLQCNGMPALPQSVESASLGPEHRLVLAPLGRGAFSVTYLGEVIVERSHSPERDAAVVLHARGITGRAVTFHRGSSTRSLLLDIARMAEIAARERGGIAARLRDSDRRERIAPGQAISGEAPPL